MTDALKLGFGSFTPPAKGVLVVFCDVDLKLGPATRKALGSAAGLVARAAKAERFTGKKNAVLELVVPEGLKAARLVVIGVGKAAELKPKDFPKLGGVAMGKLPNSASNATVFAELPGGAMKSEQVADLAQGERVHLSRFGVAAERPQRLAEQVVQLGIGRDRDRGGPLEQSHGGLERSHCVRGAAAFTGDFPLLFG